MEIYVLSQQIEGNASHEYDTDELFRDLSIENIVKIGSVGFSAENMSR